eukprot:GHVH01015430.1.p1 GENE.GHVH01015430.1~~GHVH01015430.1.p1  ORF type:complete len:184 (-),score=25.53 GHVH01015430.1:137-688(-)
MNFIALVSLLMAPLFSAAEASPNGNHNSISITGVFGGHRTSTDDAHQPESMMRRLGWFGFGSDEVQVDEVQVVETRTTTTTTTHVPSSSTSSSTSSGRVSMLRGNSKKTSVTSSSSTPVAELHAAMEDDAFINLIGSSDGDELITTTNSPKGPSMSPRPPTPVHSKKSTTSSTTTKAAGIFGF